MNKDIELQLTYLLQGINEITPERIGQLIGDDRLRVYLIRWRHDRYDEIREIRKELEEKE